MSATAVKEPKYFPNDRDLPFPPDDPRWYYEHLSPIPLKWALSRMGFRNPELPAEMTHQLHYWLNNEDVGIHKRGFRWVYNTVAMWRKEQFFWVKDDKKLWNMINSLEKIGWVVSNNFNQSPLLRMKFYTLDYVQIYIDTAGLWNPRDLAPQRLDNYPRPIGFIKGERSSTRHFSDDSPPAYSHEDVNPASGEKLLPNLQKKCNEEKCSTGLEPSPSSDLAFLENGNSKTDKIHFSAGENDLYSKNSNISTKYSKNSEKKESENCKESAIEQNLERVKESTNNLDKDLPESTKIRLKTNISPPHRPVDAYLSPYIKGIVIKKDEIYSVLNEQVIYVWEVMPGVVEQMFLEWRSNHYRRQDETWSDSPCHNASREIIKLTEQNPRMVVPLWIDFLRETDRAADGAIVRGSHDLDATLPECYNREVPDTQKVETKLAIAFRHQEESQKKQQAKLEAQRKAVLPPAGETEEERFWASVQEKLALYKCQWQNFKDKPQLRRLFDEVVEKVSSTPGLVMTNDGPALDPDFVFGEGEAVATAPSGSSFSEPTSAIDTDSPNDGDDDPDTDPPLGGGGGSKVPPHNPNPQDDGGAASDTATTSAPPAALATPPATQTISPVLDDDLTGDVWDFDMDSVPWEQIEERIAQEEAIATSSVEERRIVPVQEQEAAAQELPVQRSSGQLSSVASILNSIAPEADLEVELVDADTLEVIDQCNNPAAADAHNEADPDAAISCIDALTTDANNSSDPSLELGRSPTSYENQVLRVGDLSIWENCPAHCQSFAPFEIMWIDTENGTAKLDLFEKPVPLSQLRRSLD